MEERRVVITGTGVISPVGNGTAAFWSALQAGRCGIRPYPVSGEWKLIEPFLRTLKRSICLVYRLVHESFLNGIKSDYPCIVSWIYMRIILLVILCK